MLKRLSFHDRAMFVTGLAGVVMLAFAFALTACATVQPNPTDPEIQQTRKLAVQVFKAVETAGNALETVQIIEIQMHDAGKIDDVTHGSFQSRLLLTARVVRTALAQIQAATRVPELKNTLQTVLDNLIYLQNDYAAKFNNTALAPSLAVITAALTVVISILQ
jgi:hypothetical protein